MIFRVTTCFSFSSALTGRQVGTHAFKSLHTANGTQNFSLKMIVRVVVTRKVKCMNALLLSLLFSATVTELIHSENSYLTFAYK